MAGTAQFRFSIDRGGTFTDVFATCPPDGHVRVLKLLSVDPAYPDAPREGIRRILEEETGEPHPRGEPVDASRIESIRMGTTVATNALLERNGERTALAITAGFRDLLHIGNQSRPRIFDLEVRTPDVLYEQVVEVKERMLLSDDGEVVGSTGERLTVRAPVDVEDLRPKLQSVLDAGVRSIAVVLMHSYLYAAHEEAVGRLATEMGFTHVSLSSAVMPMVRIVPRGFTACADAYLTPCVQAYVQGFASGFKGELAGVNVLFMQSDGGLTPMGDFKGARAIVSGPAGGVVGYASTAFDPAAQQAVIGFDMGGTSTDVSRFAGSYEHVFEATTAGVTIQAPQLDINTVAAGGGSRLFFRGGLFVVGPESSRAHPGPVCYRKGGPLAITDANVFLGRIDPECFPHIFGETEDQPLDYDATVAAFNALTADINAFLSAKADGKSGAAAMSSQEVALGFIRVANETMCRPIRELTQAKGYNTSDHVLACFGGAGGQHACAIARSLGMTRIFVQRYSGILSAFGLSAADVVHEEQQPCADVLGPASLDGIWERLQALRKDAQAALAAQGFQPDDMSIEPYLNLRYRGTDCALMTPAREPGSFRLDELEASHVDGFKAMFELHYEREFGFVLPEKDVLIDDIRLRATGHTAHKPRQKIAESSDAPTPLCTKPVFFEGGATTPTPFYQIAELCHGQEIVGPALLIDPNSTILVEPYCTARLTAVGDVEIIVGDGIAKPVTKELDMIHLSVFSHRFMSIAEQMGRALQRTSVSTNIKERLDFSCALFSPDGGLVANAPHIPVHLGAMQEAVRYQLRVRGSDILPGDVLVSNHPAAGGSHLPDITVMTPVFTPQQPDSPVFFVASRGHHADIGGITPGSMPPKSVSLLQEGAAIKSFKLVSAGVFQEAGITNILMQPGELPESSGTRNLADNLSDLKAQIAANHRGIALVNELIEEYGLEVVLAYMQHVQDNAEVAVREMLIKVAEETTARTGRPELFARDFMDDGTPLDLKVTIDKYTGSAVFDYQGTGNEVFGNCNAPRAVTYSAVIYCMRCFVGHDIPLNQGCLAPVTIKIPEGSILWPSDEAAVVGGNVLTSQRVVDVVLQAFSACGCSQGCMNNITFGDENVGYYETVAGGAGAGPGWHGRSGVHSHMTNTRITDPEILERRYPVVLETFMLRDGSGGAGKFRGGDGVVRELRFRRPLTLSILCERRAFQPPGACGGGPGARGINTLIRAGGKAINLGAKATVQTQPGDLFRLETPGGGGFLPPAEDDESGEGAEEKAPVAMERGSLAEYRRKQESA